MARCNYFDPAQGVAQNSASTQNNLETLSVGRGDSIGVVLLMPGAPETRGDVHAYLTRQYLDESGAGSFKRRRVRGFLSRARASRKLTLAVDQINEIGGGVSLNLLAQDQARALTSRLRRRYGAENDVFIDTYVAARYGSFTAEKAVARMRADGVNKIVLVPMFPSYAATLSDFCSHAWSAFRAGGSIAKMDKAWITGALTNIGFIRAVQDRIDHAMQRFPVNLKDRIHVLFVARWPGSRSWLSMAGLSISGLSKSRRSDSGHPPEEVVKIVDRITDAWQYDFNYSIGRLNSGFRQSLDPVSIRSVLREIREEGTRAVLVVPVDHSSDQIDSAYRLDVILRDVAKEEGVSHFNVASAVNCHPNFIRSLTDKIAARIEFEGLRSHNPDRAAVLSDGATTVTENGSAPGTRQEEKYV